VIQAERLQERACVLRRYGVSGRSSREAGKKTSRLGASSAHRRWISSYMLLLFCFAFVVMTSSTDFVAGKTVGPSGYADKTVLSLAIVLDVSLPPVLPSSG